jgi:putative DNA primase/helicase
MTGLAPDLDQARRFLTLIDPGADACTFQTFDDSPLKRGTLARVTHGDLESEWRRLAAWQKSGAGVFVTVNQTDGRGRKAENIIRARAVVCDLDGAPLDPVMRCPLRPHVVVESSPGRYHAYWIVNDLPLDQFSGVQKAIAARFGGDPSVHDLPRVMRLCGFWHPEGRAVPLQNRARARRAAIQGGTDRRGVPADQNETGR